MWFGLMWCVWDVSGLVLVLCCSFCFGFMVSSCLWFLMFFGLIFRVDVVRLLLCIFWKLIFRIFGWMIGGDLCCVFIIWVFVWMLYCLFFKRLDKIIVVYRCGRLCDVGVLFVFIKSLDGWGGVCGLGFCLNNLCVG